MLKYKIILKFLFFFFFTAVITFANYYVTYAQGNVRDKLRLFMRCFCGQPRRLS